MTTVILGSNRFTDCAALLRIRDHVVLRVETEPMRVTLSTPAGIRGVSEVHVEANDVRRPSRKLSPRCVVAAGVADATVVYRDYPVLIARQTQPGTVHLRVDLRPLGIAFYDDPSGLHVGESTLAQTEFIRCATAIALS
ncbi:MAG: hypothetical protein AAB434_09110 [Planctomycetota bacterium]